ncbi:MAG: iron-containing alcohol dehydrogenase [Cyanothece sp. SIO1E1]|nr:iron-containing alcohol dehydrogenase [Cyanothece sp. SIO1E1]
MSIDYTQPLALKPGERVVLSTELTHPSPYVLGYRIHDQLLPYVINVAGIDPIDQFFLISDSTVANLYGSSIHIALRESNLKVHTLILPIGERAKTFAQLESLCETLIARGATKRSILVALGGGAISNVVGLAAGLLFRGIRHVEIPTTFTHLTDGALSNKQAINGCSGKNHFGLYQAPILVWGDTHYLTSEPRRLRDSGLVEGIKNGLIDQPAFLAYLRAAFRPDGVYSPNELTELAYKTLLSKLEILKQDPTEKHYCIILEYGHTFAHAIEWLARGDLLHGEAVGLGMRIAARLAHCLGLISADIVALHDAMIGHYLGMNTPLPKAATSEAILQTMGVDNKKTGNSIRYCLLKCLGACANPEGDYLVAVEDHIVLEVLRSFEFEVRTPHEPILMPPSASACYVS